MQRGHANTGDDGAGWIVNDTTNAGLGLGDRRQDAQDKDTHSPPETPIPHLHSIS